MKNHSDILPERLAFHTKSVLDRILDTGDHVEFESVDAVLMHLALCHTVVIDKRKGTFNSSSPDEIALLEGVKAQGYVFMGK